MKKLFSILLLFSSLLSYSQELNKMLFYADKFYAEEDFISAAMLYKNILLTPSSEMQLEQDYPYQANTKYTQVEINQDSASFINDLKIKWANALYMSQQYGTLDSLLNSEQKPLSTELKILENKLLIANEQYDKVLQSQPNQVQKEIAQRGVKEKGNLSFKAILIERVQSNAKSTYNFNGNNLGILTDESLQSSIYNCSLKNGRLEKSNVLSPKKWKHDIQSFTKDSVNNIIYFSSRIEGESNIYFTQKVNGEYTAPRKLNNQVNSSNTFHPAYDYVNKRLYFSSDRPEGMGGKDIWYCPIDKYGNTDSVFNAKNINTKFDEIAPYISKNGQLFFSSNNYSGIGGFDLYKFDSSIVNLGMPFNSGKNDIFYAEYQGKSWISSNRKECPDCMGMCLDLYAIEAYDITVNVIVKNKESGDVIESADVSILSDLKSDSKKSDENGKMEWSLAPSTKYYFTANKEGYFKDTDSLQTEKKGANLQITLFLAPIPEGEITLEGILYDLAKWSLRPESEASLDELVLILKENPEIKIELSSHTDTRGSARYNQRLSQKRAESCVNYLIEKGIDPERLVAKGYGESKPKIKNARTEEEHQQNRRTSFIVIQ